jgi:N-acetylneuraminate synthase
MLTSKSYLIAEIGINHNGNFEVAQHLIKSAFDSGANAIKFQYRNLSRAYGPTSNEIGDEILKIEITKNSLKVEEIIDLYRYAKSFNLDVGISFFDVFDIKDFNSFIDQFDFFKIPSVELTNINLIEAFYKYNKPILISTGAHSENEIERVFKQITYENWIPLHCVSNYPVSEINSKLGYINHMQKTWKRPIGYSSHDENWEICILAFSLGAKVIERHITLDKNQFGLDHSTSSTPEEFKKLANIMANFDEILSGNTKREINQGELINLQNLSKSFFAKRPINSGEPFNLIDFEYKHPRVGLSKADVQTLLGKKLAQFCKQGAALTEAHFRTPTEIPSDLIELCNNKKISLPIRLHDYQEIQDKFRIENFELHLSAADVMNLEKFKKISNRHSFSIHLPDYQDSTRLLNPFTDEYNNKKESINIIRKVKDFAKKLSETQNDKVIVVASFSPRVGLINDFYENCQGLQLEFAESGLDIAFQWLPPFAWYFGGSVKLNAFNKLIDVDYILQNNLNICLDTSHLLMSAKYFEYDPSLILKLLRNQILHFHLADATGIDGEGVHLGQGDVENQNFLSEVLGYPQRKVLEVWQGHLNLYQGFFDAILSVKDLHEGR